MTYNLVPLPGKALKSTAQKKSTKYFAVSKKRSIFAPAKAKGVLKRRIDKLDNK